MTVLIFFYFLYTVLMQIIADLAVFNGSRVEFQLPSACRYFLALDIAGTVLAVIGVNSNHCKSNTTNNIILVIMNKSQLVRTPFAETHLWLPKYFCLFRCLSSPWGDETPGRIASKFCIVIGTHDVIMCTKFRDDRLRGFWSAGCQSLPFPIDFAGRPYNSATLPRAL